MRQHRFLGLLTLTFLVGLVSLTVEIVALRTLAPHFGNTLFVTSSVIATILAALSLGYWLGGILADRRPELPLLLHLVIAAGVSVLGIVWLTPVLPRLASAYSIAAGPPIASLLLFFLPGLLMGLVAPFVVRLLHDQGQHGVGQSSGLVFFISTLGSIVGTVGAAYLLIPRLSTTTIYMLAGILLIVTGLLPQLVLGLRQARLPSLLLVLLIGATAITAASPAPALYQRNGRYEQITVLDGTYRTRPARFLKLDQNNSSAQYLDDPTEHVYEYTKYYRLAAASGQEPERALVIGAGAYTIPQALLRDSDHVRVDVADIEPRFEDIGRTYFGVTQSERLQTHVADGRRFLAEASIPYDLIFSDVYYSLHAVPPHFTTREFFQLAKSRLSDHGIFIANLIGTLDTSRVSFVPAEIKTFRSIFPQGTVYASDDPTSRGLQNVLLVGSAQPLELPDALLDARGRALIPSLASHEIDLSRMNLGAMPELTDTYAPVEWMMANTLRGFE